MVTAQNVMKIDMPRTLTDSLTDNLKQFGYKRLTKSGYFS
ncbi:hypothetical protein VRK_18630 [Vibrio sp. MEBiC08052]|nr:hypothetical protein VRK_18630 [Vibrio sp. MEBiC08052]